ncbi:retrovirus-related pol polyprotein from transposon TNT 1-94 [Tanacetum coccineum]|uniref:Retrovirus-related pol polyprotein from transposon TNT 1-94 n=1 Tax=Tanacetum coccineum TaxID=301880 RepID=A0ABQ5IMW9_9ASTR
MLKWQPQQNLLCSLCKEPDSHNHLFFKCKFANMVWKKMNDKMKMSKQYNNLNDVVNELVACPFKNNIWKMLNRIVVASNVYHLWQERNKRIFQQESRNEEVMVGSINDNDFQENSDDEADERTSEEYLRDLALGSDKEEVSGDDRDQSSSTNGLIRCVELSVRNNHARNGKWIDITMKKVNIILSMDEDSDCEKILNQKKKVLGGEQLTETSSKNDAKDNPFVLASLDYDYEMVLKSKDWVESLNPESKLPNFNTGRILVPKSKAVNEYLQLTEGASPSSEILKSKAKPYPPCTHCGFNDHHPDDCRNYPECEICETYDHFTSEHNRVIQIRGGVLSESSQSSESSIGVSCTTCGSSVYSTTYHNDFEHFKRGEKLQATKAKEPIKNGCSKSMTDVKSYLHKYVEQLGLKVVFGDNSSCITEGYGSINCGSIVFSKAAFQGIIFNANKKIVLMAPRRNDVYVLDMSLLTLNGACFFTKVSESVNWLWHKRLSHLNFKSINKLAKQNKVFGLPSLVYSKDKPCSACEKGKHKRASFKTKQNFSIKKCLHLLHMDLFRPVNPMSINHEKYTLVIVDEYSRYTWVYFLKKKSQAAKMIMPFVRMVKNQNDVKVKKIKTDNGSEFRNTKLESFCNEKGISQNFSSPYTPEQNGVAKRKNKTLIEAARTMPNGSVLSKHFWTKAVRKPVTLKTDKSLLKDMIGLLIRHSEKGYQTLAIFMYLDVMCLFIITRIILGNLMQKLMMVIAPNEQDNPQTEDIQGPPNQEITEVTLEQGVQDRQINHQPTEEALKNNIETSDRWSRDQHIEFINIIGDPSEGMLIRIMVAKLTAASTSECLFADFLSKIEPKMVSKALKHPGWVDAMQEELN